MVKAACGIDSFPAALPPGNSMSYVAMYTYADWGIPLYPGSLFHTPDGAGVYFCNGFHADYDHCMEGLFAEEDYDVKTFLDSAASRRRVFLYNHPNRVLYRIFWDAVNYNGVNRHPMYEWEEPQRCTPGETARYYRRLRELLDALATDSRFRICTVDELRDRALAAQCGPDRFLPPYFDLGGRHIGPADLLFAMLGAAEGAEAVTVTPRRQQCEYEDVYPALRDLRFAGTWMHAEDFADRFLSDRLRLQAWTIRPEAAGGIR